MEVFTLDVMDMLYLKGVNPVVVCGTGHDVDVDVEWMESVSRVAVGSASTHVPLHRIVGRLEHGQVLWLLAKKELVTQAIFNNSSWFSEGKCPKKPSERDYLIGEICTLLDQKPIPYLLKKSVIVVT